MGLSMYAPATALEAGWKAKKYTSLNVGTSFNFDVCISFSERLSGVGVSSLHRDCLYDLHHYRTFHERKIPYIATQGSCFAFQGGIKAVVNTDFFQALVLFVGLLAILIVVCRRHTFIHTFTRFSVHSNIYWFVRRAASKWAAWISFGKSATKTEESNSSSRFQLYFHIFQRYGLCVKRRPKHSGIVVV